MARLPPSRHAVHCSLRIPDLREGDDSPLRTSSRRSAPATCHTRQLPTPRTRPCGVNGTSQTRSPPCAEGSSQRSSHACHLAPAAAAQQRNVDVVIYNSVVLAILRRKIATARSISQQPSGLLSSRTDGARCSCAPANSSSACRSLLIAGNQPFGESGKVFLDQAMTSPPSTASCITPPSWR